MVYYWQSKVKIPYGSFICILLINTKQGLQSHGSSVKNLINNSLRHYVRCYHGSLTQYALKYHTTVSMQSSIHKHSFSSVLFTNKKLFTKLIIRNLGHDRFMF